MRSTIARLLVCLILLCGSLISPHSYAVSITDIYFKELTLRDGLSDLTVLDIAEDKDGYIWIATLTGLNRYSGYDIKQYTPSDAEGSLPAGSIHALFTDSQGQLWVGINTSLARYEPKTDSFKTIQTEKLQSDNKIINAVIEVEDNNLLLAAGTDLYITSENKESIKPYLISKKITKSIISLFDEKNRLWIGTQGAGLYFYDKIDKKIYSAREANPWSINITARRINQISVIDGKYRMATDQGYYSINANGQYTELYTQKREKGLAAPHVFYGIEVNGDIWLGTDTGLYIYNYREEELLSVSPENAYLTGLNQRYLLSGFKDSTGNVWIGSYQGLYKYNKEDSLTRVYSSKKPYQEKTDGNSIWALAEDKEQNIWFATQSEGIGRFSFDSGIMNYYLTDHEETFWDLEIDNNGYFWIATSDGVQVYKKNGIQFKFIDTFYKGHFIDTLFLSNDSLLFTIENNELISIDINAFTENLTQADKKSITSTHKVDANSEFFIPKFVDDKNRLWISVESGLIIYDKYSDRVVHKIDSQWTGNAKTLAIFKWRNSYWFITSTNLIFQVDKNSFEIKKDHEIELNKNMAMAAENFENVLWVATSNTIYGIDLSNFSQVDSFSLEQIGFNSFNEGASLRTANGNLLFAGNEGFNRINPAVIEEAAVRETTTRAPIILPTKVFGYSPNSLSEDGQKLLRAENNNGIMLQYDESRFSVPFLLANPKYPELVEYRYRFLGYDENWLETEGSRTAQFNNIPFGQYEFQVQAREAGSQWSPAATMKISIGRPPWLHTAALVFYAAILSGLLLFIVRQYQLRKQNQLAIQESEERLKLTLWSSGDELWDWDVYRGQVFRSNTWGTLDFPQDNIRTSTAYDANIHPNDLLRVQEALKAHLEGHTEYYELTYRAKTFSNQWIWILDRGKVVSRDHNAQPIRMTGTLKNIHHLKEAEEQLNLFKRSIENISEGVFISNTNFKFISVNNAYCKYTGETRDQALASYLYFHQYPEPFTEEIKKTLRAKGNWFGEVESARVNGEKFEMELNIDAVHNEDGRISHFVGVFSDITSRKSTEKELLKLANTDPLTDLPNRSFFQASHQNLVRRGGDHALLCLDMDNFKKINDSLGHQTGDVLIKQIAKRIQRTIGKTATCYRLGGDEFSVLLEDKSDIHTITHYAQGLLDTLSRPFIINKQEFVLGASIGIAFYPEDGNTPQEMLKNADTAMYFAKNNGGNSYKFFSGEMNQNAVRQLQIENLIRQGIKDDLFSVFYQPKVDINTGRLVSMEALVRFEHPNKGIVSPGQFIPLAEQTGQIIEIGEQVLRKALSDTKRWVSEGIFSGRVAVNISAKQFELPDLDDRIIRILSEIGLSPLHLECEITEGTLMENPEEGLRMMERLREKGIHLALDDFGTGYSSLAYLKRFPLNTLKIDKAFIDDIAKSSVDRHMAAAIINIAHNLGLKVVAEGVEEESQLTILRRYECEMLQGFLYSKPINAERFEQLLRENQKLHNLISHSNS
ncbi:EAL domain-containing protein [Salinimonas sediminis]|uniref:EAL domain-containing protein n=1 Tax=Salinimonas sediminis TaxID=2303538 RepID=UPI001E55D06A|nr:EAL domain-containing protein [Salinimonas sediminis]